MSALLRAALDYAALGWPVFPLIPGTKKPSTLDGFKSATTEPTQIRAWYEQTPDANIGARCEPFAVLDLDVKPEKGKRGDRELVELVLRHGAIGWTRQAITPSGGTHFFFRSPDGVRIPRTIGKFAPAIDVLGHGGYVVLPPSRIGGKGYAWIEDGAELSEPSAWVLERMLAGAEPVVEAPVAPQLGRFGADAMTRIDRALKYLDKMDASVSGKGGHDSAWRAACVLVHKFTLPADVALECLRHFNARCAPPWSEKELAHKIRQAQSRAHTYSNVEAVS